MTDTSEKAQHNVVKTTRVDDMADISRVVPQTSSDNADTTHFLQHADAHTIENSGSSDSRKTVPVKQTSENHDGSIGIGSLVHVPDQAAPERMRPEEGQQRSRYPASADWKRWTPILVARYESATVRELVSEMNADGLRVTQKMLRDRIHREGINDKRRHGATNQERRPASSADTGSGYHSKSRAPDVWSSALQRERQGKSNPAIGGALDQPEEPRSTSHSTKLLDPLYKVRGNPYKFFQFGKVFLMLWTEPAGGKSNNKPNHDIFRVAFGEKVHVKIRRFVVVRPGVRSCVCLAISTHGGKGISHPGVEPQEHAIIYTGREALPLDAQEMAALAGMPSLLPSIRVDPDEPLDQLDPMSRIDFGKPYTIRHDVKVRPFGMVNQISLATLKVSFVTSMSLRAFPTDLSVFAAPHTLRALEFPSMESRKWAIPAASAGTCSWLLETTQYASWRDASRRAKHHGILWIKGKPGSGKSTLMKFVSSQIQEKSPNNIVISFYFNARGAELERSLKGMYRSLLRQLWRHESRIAQHLPHQTLLERDCDWSTEVLFDLMKDTLKGYEVHESVFLFVDALDEVEQDDARLAIQHFEQLSELSAAENRDFFVCLSSRYYPHISTYAHEEVQLDYHPGHQEDIRRYVTSDLGRVPPLIQREGILTQITDRARGIFLWVTLVLNRLRKAYDRGETPSQLKSILDEMPHGLYQLFSGIACNPDKEFFATMQWILFAKRPLSVVELFLAVHTSIGSLQRNESNYMECDVNTMQNYIVRSSRGLVEFYTQQYPGPPHARLIHEFVALFLESREWLLSNLASELNLVTSSHLMLANACLDYLKSGSPGIYNANTGHHDSLHKEYPLHMSMQRAPLLEYAWCNGLSHLEDAFIGGSRDFDLLTNFSWQVLAMLNQSHAGAYPKQEHSASAIYVSTLTRPGLVKFHLQYAPIFSFNRSESGCTRMRASRSYATPDLTSFCGGCFGSPLHAAASLGHLDIVRLLLECGADVNLRGSAFKKDIEYPSPLEAAIFWLGMKDVRTSWTHIGARLVPDVPCLPKAQLSLWSSTSSHTDFTGFPEPYGSTDNHCHVSHLDHTPNQTASDVADMVKLLLNWGATIEHERSFSALHTACKCRNLEVAQMLLDHGAGMKVKDKEGRTALHWAIMSGTDVSGSSKTNSRSMIRVLIEASADLGDADDEGDTPLMVACSASNLEPVKILLERGVEIEAQNAKGHTAMILACSRDSSEALQIVQALYDRGADINARDREGRTPLIAASYTGRREVVQFLLEHGKEIITDHQYATALEFARARGRMEIIELLLWFPATMPHLGKSIKVALKIARWVGYTKIIDLLVGKLEHSDTSEDDKGETQELLCLSEGRLPDFVTGACPTAWT